MVSKKIVAEAIIQKAEEDYEDVKIMTSMVEGFEKPDTIMNKDQEKEGFTPDVMLRSNDVTELFEIELSQDFKLEKWKLFSKFSNSKKRSFSIVTQEEHVNPLRNFLNQNHIEARILYFA
jgi:hypothetical protein